jgi:hypothetical protein
MKRARRWAMLGMAAALVLAAPEQAPAEVETLTQFLEYDQAQGVIAYKVVLRNRGSLPVRGIKLDVDPPCREGAWELSELSKEEVGTRQFSFDLPAGQLIFQPRFSLAYTDNEGERVEIAPGQSRLATTMDFTACQVATGRVTVRFTFTNPGEEPLLFLELSSENPRLAEGSLELGDLKPGETIQKDIEFQLQPGERIFNPTVHLLYHAFYSQGTRIHRSFYTFLQPDLQRVEDALAAR